VGVFTDSLENKAFARGAGTGVFQVVGKNPFFRQPSVYGRSKNKLGTRAHQASIKRSTMATTGPRDRPRAIPAAEIRHSLSVAGWDRGFLAPSETDTFRTKSEQCQAGCCPAPPDTEPAWRDDRERLTRQIGDRIGTVDLGKACAAKEATER
jgi:hypothetical protein